MSTKLLRSVVGGIIGVGILMIATAIASAAPITVGSGWVSFGFGAVGTTTNPFTYSSNSITRISVTDVGCKGDEFAVHDGDNDLGATSAVANGPCPDEMFNPDIAFADPAYSHGTFYVGPGSHSILITTTETPSGGGGAFLRVDEVSITKADCKDGGWTSFGALFTNQGDCVSFAVTAGKNEPGKNRP